MFGSLFLNAFVLLAQAQEEKTSPGWSIAFPLLAVAALWFILILPMQRRQRQQQQAVQTALKKNARVVTTSGIIGTVAAIHENGDISLKVDDNSPLRIRMTKGSVVSVFSDEAAKPAADATTAVKS
jgi:preprotein translocase subunit YajC